MNVLANKRLDLDIINIISDLSTELQIKAFLVGGYVRDLILDRKSKDIDILIVGDGISFANEVKKKLHGKVDLQIFKNFGTAMIIYDGFEIEFVGSRKESYQKNSRNPSITVGTFEDDISRPRHCLLPTITMYHQPDVLRYSSTASGLSNLGFGWT